MIRAGKDPLAAARTPESWGDDADLYFAQLEVFHEIHCVDLLRREIEYDYYWKPVYGEQTPPPNPQSARLPLLTFLIGKSDV